MVFYARFAPFSSLYSVSTESILLLAHRKYIIGLRDFLYSETLINPTKLKINEKILITLFCN